MRPVLGREAEWWRCSSNCSAGEGLQPKVVKHCVLHAPRYMLSSWRQLNAVVRPHVHWFLLVCMCRAQWCRGGIVAALVDCAASLGGSSSSSQAYQRQSTGGFDLFRQHRQHRSRSLPGAPPSQQTTSSSSDRFQTIQALSECCCLVLLLAAEEAQQAKLLVDCVRRALAGRTEQAVPVLQLLRMLLRQVAARHEVAASGSAVCAQLHEVSPAPDDQSCTCTLSVLAHRWQAIPPGTLRMRYQHAAPVPGACDTWWRCRRLQGTCQRVCCFCPTRLAATRSFCTSYRAATVQHCPVCRS